MIDDTHRLLTETSDVSGEFGLHTEKSIISLALDHPDLFLSVGRFMTPQLFESPYSKYLIAVLLNHLEQHDIVPTRGLLRDHVLNHLTEDDPYEEILEIVDLKANPRDIPIIKEQLVSWAKKRAYGLIYSEEAMMAYQNNDFDYIEKVVTEAGQISDMQVQGFWLLDNYEVLFNPEIIEHRTTGFARLDAAINTGGPSPKEVFCWLAGTNVGKSLLLCNNTISSWKGAGSGGRIGQDVLLVTFELDYVKTAMRMMGIIAEDIPINDLIEHKDIVTSRIDQMKTTYDGRIFIAELPPEECSVDHLHTLLDNLRRTEGWKPDVVVIDYLDLMVSRNKRYNDDDYTRQKYVASEVRGFAKKEHVLVYTATQTNRKKDDNQVADLSSAAESYAKQFSMDYVVSVNQSQAELVAAPPRFRFFIAKNRNGPKGRTITCEVDYNTMRVKEINA